MLATDAFFLHRIASARRTAAEWWRGHGSAVTQQKALTGGWSVRAFECSECEGESPAGIRILTVCERCGRCHGRSVRRAMCWEQARTDCNCAACRGWFRGCCHVSRRGRPSRREAGRDGRPCLLYRQAGPDGCGIRGIPHADGWRGRTGPHRPCRAVPGDGRLLAQHSWRISRAQPHARAVNEAGRRPVSNPAPGLSSTKWPLRAPPSVLAVPGILRTVLTWQGRVPGP